jgi:hypothetical protein
MVDVMPPMPVPLPPVGGPMSNEERVFGVGFQRDEHGNPIERGHGAPGRETPQHVAAKQRTMNFLQAQAESDPAALKKLILDIVRPPEDQTPEDRAKAQAAEKVQEDKIAALEAANAALSAKLDALLEKFTSPSVPSEVAERKVSIEDNPQF